jgi:hypothetical protein
MNLSDLVGYLATHRRCDLYPFRAGPMRNLVKEGPAPGYPETGGLSWPWLTYRVFAINRPALPLQAPLPRQRNKLEQSTSPMNFLRPFDVYQHTAATYTGLPNPAAQRPRP